MAVSGGRDERGDDDGKRVGARMQRVRVRLSSATRRGLAAAPTPGPAAASEHSSLPPAARACRRAVGGRRLAGWDAKRAGPPRRATRALRTPPPQPPAPGRHGRTDGSALRDGWGLRRAGDWEQACGGEGEGGVIDASGYAGGYAVSSVKKKTMPRGARPAT